MILIIKKKKLRHLLWLNFVALSWRMFVYSSEECIFCCCCGRFYMSSRIIWSIVFFNSAVFNRLFILIIIESRLLKFHTIILLYIFLLVLLVVLYIFMYSYVEYIFMSKVCLLYYCRQHVVQSRFMFVINIF